MTILTAEIQNKLCTLAQSNIPLETACLALDLDPATVALWIEAPKTREQRDFAKAHRKAQAIGEIDRIQTLQNHAKTDATAAFKLHQMTESAKRFAIEKKPGQEPLTSAKHERFARFISKAMDIGPAYAKTYPKSKKRSADSAGSLLLKNHDVKQRVQYLKTLSASEEALTQAERRRFMARVVRVNLTKFNPEKDGDLIEEVTEENGKKRYKLASKRGCVMDDAKLAGDLIDKAELTGKDGAPLPSAVPETIICYLPPHMAKPRIPKETV